MRPEGDYTLKGHRLIVLLALAICLALIVQCGLVFESDLDEVNSENRAGHHDPGILIGTWRLIENCNFAWGEGCKSIEESGERDLITFAADGSYTRVLWDTLSFVGTYRIVLKEDFRFNRPDTMLELDENTDMAYSFRHRDTLSLGIVAIDACSGLYARVQDDR